ncbi:4'-phosphopantetheinyl transferase superfamily protein [Sneathiella marina]|uniref:4'-phosphopantetheinyl transferase superfamily protein n=1 Tax=Sneathiella marina TaxID=2950108 RepID=A0ABY4WCZ0_9PROT|nr:4'-phosphopantetheinyl transferase superfamily protein [Sneathiella marina]USG63124.1 4'-phosphopantetheinyl transferase superfamily protein [Sneathiella marina]
MEFSGDFQNLRDIHIWTCPVDPMAASRYDNTLAATERARAERFATEELRDKYIVQQGVLRDILSRYLNCTAAEVEFTRLAYGKPGLASSGHPQGNLAFNLSHTKGQLVASVTLDTEIGVDIEFHNRRTDWKGISDSYFTTEENDWLLNLPEEQGFTAFYDIWTMKEAVMKADGRGLNLPIEEISFDLPSTEIFTPAIVQSVAEPPEIWWGRTLDLGQNVSASVVCQNKDAVVQMRRYI